MSSENLLVPIGDEGSMETASAKTDGVFGDAVEVSDDVPGESEA